MPLFTVISAYLYASSPATRESLKKLVTGKARRIMIPFLAVSTIQYLIFALLPMQNSPALENIYRVYIWPHEQLWFLYSIFEIFVIIGVLDAFNVLSTPKKWLACLAVSLVLHVFFHTTGAFSIEGVKYLMPFFLLGYGIRRFSGLLCSRKALRIYALLGLVSALGWALLYVRPILPENAHQCVGLLVTFTAVPLLFHFRPSVPFLARIGYYAFGIHLFNRIAVSATRAVFEHLNLHNTLVQFTTYMILGIATAILAQLILERFAFTRRFILGLKPEVKPKKTGPTIVPIYTFPVLNYPRFWNPLEFSSSKADPRGSA
jgi:hypothetical protein